MSDFSIHDLFQLPWNADEILQVWIALERENQHSESTALIEDWLHSPDFNRFRSDFDSHFNDQVDCLFVLAGRVQQGGLCADETLSEWCRAAQSLRQSTGNGTASLQQTMADVGLLGELVETTLQCIAASKELDPEIATALVHLVPSRSIVPVPPSLGSSLIAADYLVSHESPDTIECVQAIHSALGNWDDDALDRIIDAAESAGAADDCDVASLAEMRDALSASLQFFVQGWPVERARLKTPSQSLLGLLNKWPTETREMLPGRCEMSARLEQLCTSIDPGSVATEQRAVDRVHEVQLVPSRKMKDVGAWLKTQHCPRATRFVLDLRNLAVTLGQSLGRDTPRIGKDIVNLLIGIDAMAANIDADTDTLHELGDRLRAILIDDFDYKVLSFDDLIGRSIHSMSDHARLYKTVTVPNHASDEIIGLHTPGYLIQYPNGRVDVVKPAEVIVSE